MRGKIRNYFIPHNKYSSINKLHDTVLLDDCRNKESTNDFFTHIANAGILSPLYFIVKSYFIKL